MNVSSSSFPQAILNGSPKYKQAPTSYVGTSFHKIPTPSFLDFPVAALENGKQLSPPKDESAFFPFRVKTPRYLRASNGSSTIFDEKIEPKYRSKSVIRQQLKMGNIKQIKQIQNEFDQTFFLSVIVCTILSIFAILVVGLSFCPSGHFF
eukprot:snap_masked-scaffold_1-processed-gene-29.28-mRNA-1 protein AED:0.43 eAED:1.00 QI:0/-1/0/1/-1/1/1/0/149